MNWDRTKFAVQEGDTFKIHDAIPMATAWKDVGVLGFDDQGRAELGYAKDESRHVRTRVPQDEFHSFAGDLAGRIHNPDNDTSTDAAIAGVLAGKGQFLGKGQDGAAFGIGDKVIKVSTGMGYHWDQPARGQAMGAKLLRDSAELNNEMIAKGVPGLLPMKIEQGASKTLVAMDRLEIPEDHDTPGLYGVPKFTPDQAQQVYATIDGMHKAGYVLRDTIQAGIDENGDVRMFDTGQAERSDSKDARKADRERVRDIFQGAGLERPYWPDEADQKFQSTLADAIGQIDKIEAGDAPPSWAGKMREMLARDYANAKKFGAPDMMEWFEEEAQDLLKRLGAAATPATVERHQETTAF